jgi:hypothetical protein
VPNTTSAPYTTSANSILNVYAICTPTSYIPGGVLTQTGDLSTIAWIIFEPGV